MEDQTSESKMEIRAEIDNENQYLNRTIKTENDIQQENDDRISSDNASSLMAESDDESFDENEDENYAAWRATENRLSSVADSDLLDCEEDLGISMENKNTQRKTDTDIRIFITYLRSINEFRAPELIQPVHLDRYLSAFFSVVKKHDGNEYEPASLRGMLCSVERYLKIKNYPQSVTRDSVFVSTRNALKFKQQKLRELGKGSKKQPEPFGRLTLDKVNHLFSAREMGPYTPMSVINTLCFLFIVHFRLRKAIDHKNLLWGDVKLQTDKNGRQNLIYEPVDIQNSIAHSKYDHHGNRLCVWETPEVKERDPVSIYKLYAEKRPQNMKYENSPFYLGITSLQPTHLQSWYRTCAMGVNKLSDLVRMIRDITGLPRATMNAPSEFILSESYGIVSVPNQDKALSTILVPDTKHVKVFGQSDSATSNKFTTLCLDSRHNESSEKKVSHLSDSNCRSSEYSSHNESLENTCSPQCGSSEKIENHNTFNNDQTMTLDEAKEKFLTIMHKVDQSKLEELQKWICTFLPQSVYPDKLKSDTKTISAAAETKPTVTLPSITLNIKISPEAISGSSPISVVADIVPQESQNENNLMAASKRKPDSDNGASNVKRLKDNTKDTGRNSPINLSSENIRSPVENFSRRVSSNQGNTAIVHPRSDKLDHGQKDIGKCDKNSSSNITTNNIQSFQENSGYVPISYPYIAPDCFSQDPRIIGSSSVFPRMAHSGTNMFAFIPSLRNISKTSSQESNGPVSR